MKNPFNKFNGDNSMTHNVKDSEFRLMTDEEEKEAERIEREEQLERDLVRNDAIYHAMKELDGKL